MIDNVVCKGGKPVLRLNQRLIAQKELTQDEVDVIKSLHLERIKIESRMKRCKKPESILRLFDTWTKVQYLLQQAWKFPLDANWHPSHRLPHCSCPVYDNDERLGTPYRVMSSDCIIHWSLK